MSRTNRKHKMRWWRDWTRKAHVDNAVAYWTLRPYEHKKVRKSKEQYEREVEWSLKDYEKRCAEYAKKHNMKAEDVPEHKEPRRYFWSGEKIYMVRAVDLPRYVGKYEYKQVPLSKEEVIKRANEEYDSFSRDGKFNETSRNKGFKNDAKKHVRNRNKRYCQDVMKGLDHENEAYPIRKEGKQFVWNWW